MPEIKWMVEDDVKGSIEEFVKKFDAKDIDGAKDTLLFYKAMSEAILLSKASDDEDKQELGEVIDDDVEEYESLCYFIRVRDNPSQDTILLLKEDDMKMGTWSGEYEPSSDVKQNVYMEMTPACSIKICYGNPNTDAEFFAGDLTVKGPLKLATKPRAWIDAFYEFIDREPID